MINFHVFRIRAMGVKYYKALIRMEGAVFLLCPRHHLELLDSPYLQPNFFPSVCPLNKFIESRISICFRIHGFSIKIKKNNQREGEKKKKKKSRKRSFNGWVDTTHSKSRQFIENVKLLGGLLSKYLLESVPLLMNIPYFHFITSPGTVAWRIFFSKSVPSPAMLLEEKSTFLDFDAIFFAYVAKFKII